MTDSLLNDVQDQRVDSGLVYLFEILISDTDESTGDAFYIHNGLNYDIPDIDGIGENLYFPNIAETAMNEYLALPCEISGIEIKSSGPSNRPTFRVANIPVLSRTISSDDDGLDDEKTLSQYLQDRNLDSAKDFLGATLRVRSTLLKYTYSSTDTVETPTEFPIHTFVLDRISAEDNLTVEFELVSPADLEKVTLPNRKMSSKYCMWEYQGLAEGRGGCAWPKASRGRYYDIDDELITSSISEITTYSSSTFYNPGDLVKIYTNPGWEIHEAVIGTQGVNPALNTKYWTRKDLCGKRINSCKVRFQGNSSDSTLDTSISIPFGGFPGTKKAT